MDVNRIRELLPHRYPFQLVDKVIEMECKLYRRYQKYHSKRTFLPGTFPTATSDAGRTSNRSNGSGRRFARS